MAASTIIVVITIVIAIIVVVAVVAVVTIIAVVAVVAPLLIAAVLAAVMPPVRVPVAVIISVTENCSQNADAAIAIAVTILRIGSDVSGDDKSRAESRRAQDALYCFCFFFHFFFHFFVLLYSSKTREDDCVAASGSPKRPEERFPFMFATFAAVGSRRPRLPPTPLFSLPSVGAKLYVIKVKRAVTPVSSLSGEAGERLPASPAGTVQLIFDKTRKLIFAAARALSSFVAAFMETNHYQNKPMNRGSRQEQCRNNKK